MCLMCFNPTDVNCTLNRLVRYYASMQRLLKPFTAAAAADADDALQKVYTQSLLTTVDTQKQKLVNLKQAEIELECPKLMAGRNSSVDLSVPTTQRP